LKPRLTGARASVRREVADVIGDVRAALEQVTKLPVTSNLTVADVKHKFAAACARYYALAAASRRKYITQPEQQAAFSLLYWVRSTLEATILGHIAACDDIEEVALTDSFFGRSSKQGVSIRYSLNSCVPTKDCGARCYAHDGRDREIHLLFRGVLNYWVGSTYEASSTPERRRLMEKLTQLARKAIAAALAEADQARVAGFARQSRIRFSHVGELVATPIFANDLARTVKRLAPEVECVVYTRHPNAALLDPMLFTVNFTLESSNDPRKKYAPSHSRIVGSAWDGVPIPSADINFLEHHVEKHATSNQGGRICPVTINPKQTPSCDSARCVACFVPPVQTMVVRQLGSTQYVSPGATERNNCAVTVLPSTEP
jgi:hypothetical protein